MNKEPETYEELIRQKRCVDLTRYYNLTGEELEQIYQFLANNPTGEVNCSGNIIKLISGSNVTMINSNCTNRTIDGIIMSNTIFNVILHYTPSSSGSSYGGSSSNNNTNNNNNNNNNR